MGEQSVSDFLRILEEHRVECEKNGKYVEAEIAKKRLDELREHEENRQREAMRSRQITEKLGVEEAHMMEFQQFNAIWDKKMEEFEMNAKQLTDNMRKKHANKLAAQEMQFAQRQTGELNALEKRIETARQEHKIQRQQDLERLLQRYQNVKSELEAQQNIERIRSEKYKGSSTMYESASRPGSARPSSARSRKNTPRRGAR